MKLEDFLEKFPDTDIVNDNCLVDMACPTCGSRGPFRIEVRTLVEFGDNGTTDIDGDMQWDENSFCRCLECDDTCGTVELFMVDGLDRHLDLRERGLLMPGHE